ncbi:MAG TPA: efflux RND transporter periplasmic adaptor subunit [Verrucomicrobiae bacterium]|nr:efflux RND transporter periplasmic adaptor subunit [Verrucomicrobiae bacterium]
MNNPKPSLDDLRIERKDKPDSNSRPALMLGLSLLLVIALAGWWWLNRPKVLEVRTALVQQVGNGGGERTVLNASGYVTARREATVSSKVTGKVVEVLIEEGMKVQEGQVLARLDDTNVRASLQLAQAQLESARKALEETRVRITEADQELARQSNLVKNKIATQADYDHAEAAALALKARLLQQQADVTVADRQVASWQQQMEDTVIRAPFAGIVTSKNAQPGEMISPISAGGGFTRTGICTIVDMQSLEIEIDVNESYINRVEAGQPVEATLDAYPDWKIPCKVIAIIPTADRQKSTVKVRVGFDQLDTRILPEMGVKVAFREAVAPTVTSARGVTVPKAAVHQLDGHDVVLVVRDDRAEKRAVTVNGTGTDDVLVTAGLNAGERVALDWPAGVADGAAIKELKQ